MNNIKERWENISPEIQKHLIEWYNVSEEDLTDEDYENLTILYEKGQFEHWECPLCGAHVYVGSPDNWDNFQGVLNADFCSYPISDNSRYNEEFSKRLCDYCRMYKQFGDSEWEIYRA